MCCPYSYSVCIYYIHTYIHTDTRTYVCTYIHTYKRTNKLQGRHSMNLKELEWLYSHAIPFSCGLYIYIYIYIYIHDSMYTDHVAGRSLQTDLYVPQSVVRDLTAFVFNHKWPPKPYHCEVYHRLIYMGTLMTHHTHGRYLECLVWLHILLCVCTNQHSNKEGLAYTSHRQKHQQLH